MNIKSHGKWRRYTPVKMPEDAPPNALFAQRESDNADWYEYLKAKDAFEPRSIKLTLHGGIVGAAVTDPTRLFPASAEVLEVSGVTVGDPQTVFGGKVYDKAAQTFTDPEPPVDKLTATLEAILKRLDALESRGP